MARVKVDLVDLSDGTCPRVCVRCGAAADRTRAVTLMHEEAGTSAGLMLDLAIGLPGRILAAVAATSTARAHLPVCPRHAGRGGLHTPAGRWRLAARVVGSWVLLLVGVLLGHHHLPDVPVAVAGPVVFLVLAAVGVTKLVRYSGQMIHTVELTDRYAVLENVSPEFARAVEAQWEADRLARDARWQNPGEG